jgi:hypothetical protein
MSSLPDFVATKHGNVCVSSFKPKHNKNFHILEIETNHRQPQVPSIPALQSHVFESAQKCVGARQTVTTHSLNAKIE